MELEFGGIVAGAGVVAAVVAIVEMLKRSLSLQSRIVPLVSLGVGVVLVLLRAGVDGPLDGDLVLSQVSALIVTGILSGLAASGLYGGAKVVAAQGG